MSTEMAQQIMRGDEIVAKLAQITAAARPQEAEPVVHMIARDTSATVAAAQAFATRTRLRAAGAAA
jgi:hypothetical protein